MHPLLQNKFVKFIGIGLAVLAAFFIVIILLASMNSSRSSAGMDSMGMSEGMDNTPSFNINSERGVSMGNEMKMMQDESSYYPPQPSPHGYTSGLENYETTEYSVTARTKQFEEMCGALSALKADSQIHFKYLNTSTNNCRATLYAYETEAKRVLDTLTNFSGAEVTRNTESVTRHRQQIQSQTSILAQQLSSVQSSLTSAEIQFDEIADFARENKDAATLSQAINQKLNNINTLTQQKINLTARLNQLYQQAADLEEMMNAVQFNVNISRSNPIYVDQESRQWEQAWKELHGTYTETLIGLSAFFGIFLLWTARLAIYLLVLIIVLRGFWKFTKLLLSKW
ncbi:MAG: hypothetical protein ACI9BF_000216 [Candidatus Paceibacteria bacterium]|jgi:hypothetical protein